MRQSVTRLLILGSALLGLHTGTLAQVRRIAWQDFPDPVVLRFEEFLFRTSGATDVNSRLGVQFRGEGGSVAEFRTVQRPPYEMFPPDWAVGVRNVAPDGNSAGRALIIRFQEPLRRVGLMLGNGSEGTVAGIEALTAKGESLGAIEQVGVELEGPFVGLETTHTEGIATLILDYGADPREEEVHQLWMEPLRPRTFCTCLAQVADGSADELRLRTLLVFQNPYESYGDTWATPVRISFFDSAGEPLQLLPGGSTGSVVEFDLAGYSPHRLESGGPPGEVRVGYATIESSLPVDVLGILQTVTGASEVASEVGVEAREPKVYQVFPVEWKAAARFDTGFAIANPGDRETKVQLKLYDSSTKFKPPWMPNWPVLTLAPREHKALFLSEICDLPGHNLCSKSFPLDEDFEGSLQVISDEPVCVTSLRTRRGWLVSSLPVGSTQR